MNKRYGDVHRIFSEYSKELRSWPKLKANNSEGFRKFHSFLVKYEANLKAHKSKRGDSPEVLQNLQRKLPLYLQSKWNKRVFSIRKNEKEETLSDFISLIEDETILINDPLYSHVALVDSDVKVQAQKKQEKIY